MTRSQVTDDMAIAADTAMSSLMLLIALQWKAQHGRVEALRMWQQIEKGVMTPGGHPNCPTYGHPNCSTWPG